MLEIGAIREDQLLQALGDQHGLPTAPAQSLQTLPREALAALPAELARRTRAIPFAIGQGTLAVTVEDPRDIALCNEISFATGKKVQFHVSPEVRICEALERAYGVPCPPRFNRLARRLARENAPGEASDSPFAGLQSALQEARGPAPAAARQQAEPPRKQSSAAEKAPENESPASVSRHPPRIELTEEERLALIRGNGQEEPLTFEARLGRATRAQEVGELLVEHLSETYERAALLLCRQDRIESWFASEEDLLRPRFTSFATDLRRPSAFLSLHHGVSFFLGPLPDSEVHRRFLACWAGPRPLESALVPVRLQRRLVCLLYVGRCSEESPRIDLGDLQALAAQAAKAFEDCILRNRLHSPGRLASV